MCWVKEIRNVKNDGYIAPRIWYGMGRNASIHAQGGVLVPDIFLMLLGFLDFLGLYLFWFGRQKLVHLQDGQHFFIVEKMPNQNLCRCASELKKSYVTCIFFLLLSLPSYASFTFFFQEYKMIDFFLYHWSLWLCSSWIFKKFPLS